jgi:hypothetical protein
MKSRYNLIGLFVSGGQMRRRLRARNQAHASKPTGAAWQTTAIIMVAAFLWYLLNLYSTVALSCEQTYAFWFHSEQYGSATMQASNLLVVTLALWFYVDLVRPKPERIPRRIRAGQASLVIAMVVISVFQWGLLKPQTQDARIYSYFEGEVSQWPIMRLFLFSDRVFIMEAGPQLTLLEMQDPAFDEVRVMEADYWLDFPLQIGTSQFSRANGRFDGRLRCTADRELGLAWERALAEFIQTREEEGAELTL